MAHARVSAEWKARVDCVRQSFADSGTGVSEWSRERGFSPSLVAGVLRGDRACVRGKSHQIAVALGLKREVPSPGPIDATSDRFEAAR